MTITRLLIAHHKKCEDMMLTAKEVAAQLDWTKVDMILRELSTELEKHLSVEEDVIFPAYEKASGIRSGPTQVMRQEHHQMRGLLQTLQQVLADQENEIFIKMIDTLIGLMQQHNMKEEQVLYPSCDRLLVVDTLLPVIQNRLS
ncbi:MAG TPA: hemerythrin domain-containing protein [Rugosibacter sp.]